MRHKEREEAVKLRELGMSYSEIKKRLGVSKSTLSYWLNGLPLSELRIRELQRIGWSKSEASREKYRNTMRAKRETKAQEVYSKVTHRFKNLPDIADYCAGLMLYQAEGEKQNRNRIVLANTDVRLLDYFVSWVKRFLNVDRSEVRVQLHLYENMNISEEETYWQKALQIPKTQFYKSSIRKLTKNSFSYSGGHKHGTCSIYILNTEKKLLLTMSIKAFLDTHKKL